MSIGAAAIGEKAHLGTKQRWTKPIALAVIELRLSEGISQSVSQLTVSQ